MTWPNSSWAGFHVCSCLFVQDAFCVTLLVIYLFYKYLSTLHLLIYSLRFQSESVTVFGHKVAPFAHKNTKISSRVNQWRCFVTRWRPFAHKNSDIVQSSCFHGSLPSCLWPHRGKGHHGLPWLGKRPGSRQRRHREIGQPRYRVHEAGPGRQQVHKRVRRSCQPRLNQSVHQRSQHTRRLNPQPVHCALLQGSPDSTSSSTTPAWWCVRTAKLQTALRCRWVSITLVSWFPAWRRRHGSLSADWLHRHDGATGASDKIPANLWRLKSYF